ncbi:MAG: TraB/GumN family protein [Desulfobacterales bacterium]
MPLNDSNKINAADGNTKIRVFLSFLLHLTIIVSLFIPAVYGDIYKWKDKDGNWRYSDQPPPESQEDSWWEEKGRVIRTNPEKSVEKKQLPPTFPETRTTASGEGMLWKIEVQGPSPSYILGTIHSEDPRVLNFSSSLTKAFDKAETFIMEVVLNESALFQTTASMMLTEGRTLESIVGEPLFNRVVNAMAGYGLIKPAVNYMKPWAVMSMLSVPIPKTGEFMDVVLYQKAISQDKNVLGLETVQDQLNVFDNMPMEDQIALLEDTLNYLDQYPDLFEKMIQTYLDGDLEGVAELGKTAMNPKNQALTEKLLKRLNDNRNITMINQMLPHLMAGNAFIAVGALHLPGPNGLLNLLAEKGFKVTAVK